MVSEFWIRKVSRPAPRALLAIALSIPMSISPWISDSGAWAVAPELVAFGQPGAEAAPSDWANQILVEDFNSVTDANLASGHPGPPGSFLADGQVAIIAAGQYGGAGGEGQFVSVGSGTLTLTLSNQSNFRYIGFHWSAGNNGNTVCLMGPISDTCLAEYSTSDLLLNNAFTNPGQGENNWQTKPHYGNPQARSYSNPTSCTAMTGSSLWWQNGSAHCSEPFAFIHIFQDSGFARVKFTATEGGFEFDNVTASQSESWQLIDLLPAGTLIGASTLPAYSLTTASVLPVDPRSGSVSFPGVLLGGAAASQPNATLCLTESDSSGNPVLTPSSENLNISATLPASGVTQQVSSPRTIYSGPQTAIQDLTRTIKINSSTVNRSVANSGSKYLRISVQARTGTGTTTCAGTNNVITAVVVELRPIRLNSVNQLGIPID